MLKSFLVGIALTAAAICHGQSGSSDIDSLTRVLATAADQQRVEVLISLGNLLRSKDPDLARRHFADAFVVAEKINDKKNAAQALYFTSRLFRGKNPDSVIYYCTQALAIDSLIGNEANVALECYSIGIQLQNKTQYADAMRFYLRGLRAAEHIHNQKLIGDGYNNMAFVHKGQRNFSAAKEYYNRALKIRIESGDSLEIASAYNNLGLAYMADNDNREARALYEKALKIVSEKQQPEFVAMIYNNIGVTLKGDNQHADALNFFFKSVAIKEENGDRRGLASTFGNVASSMNALSRHGDAIIYGKKSYQLAKDVKQIDYMITALKNLATAYATKHDFKNAYDAQSELRILEDSAFSISRSEQILAMTAKYETEKKEKENELLKREIRVHQLESENQQWIIFAVTAAVVLIGAIAGLLYFFNTRYQRVTTALENQNNIIAGNNALLTELMKEKNSLMNIVAHDLKSPLNKVLGLSELLKLEGGLNERQQEYIAMINDVAVQGRKLITDLLTVNKIEANGTHFNLEEIDLCSLMSKTIDEFASSAKEKQIDLHLQMNERPAIIRTDRDCLQRIIDNLISNAIKFSPFGRNVYITLQRGDQDFTIAVRDEGPGISDDDRKRLFRKFERLSAQPTNGEASTGLGLAIVKELVTQLRGHVDVASEHGHGATFLIKLPLM